MDRRERFEDMAAAMLAALTGWQRALWTATPGIVNTYDAAKLTMTVQPSIQASIEQTDGSLKWVDLPLLLDVPVIFMGGGGYRFTFPIQSNDECLVVFASRCIDTWWQSGGHKNKPPSLRMHDLSDGFAIVGPFSQVKVLANVSTTKAQLRSDDGLTYLEMGGGAVDIVAPSGVTINGVAIDSAGTVNAPGEGTFSGHTVGGHTHPDPQGGNTGTPTG